MLTFGALSSVFDYLTFGVLLWIMHVDQAISSGLVPGVCDLGDAHCIGRSNARMGRGQPAIHDLAGNRPGAPFSPFTLAFGFSRIPASSVAAMT